MLSGDPILHVASSPKSDKRLLRPYIEPERKKHAELVLLPVLDLATIWAASSLEFPIPQRKELILA